MKTTYISLMTYTEQGIRNLEQSPDRARAFRESAQAAGITVVGQYWTAGNYDAVLIAQADDEQKLLGALTRLAADGNVRTHSLRAFDAQEFAALVRK